MKKKKVKEYLSQALRHRLANSSMTYDELEKLSGVSAELLRAVLRDQLPCPRRVARQLLLIAHALPEVKDAPKLPQQRWLAYRAAVPQKHTHHGHLVGESTEEPQLPAEPTHYLVGSIERIEIMAQRAARGEALRHPEDEPRRIPPGSTAAYRRD